MNPPRRHSLTSPAADDYSARSSGPTPLQRSAARVGGRSARWRCRSCGVRDRRPRPGLPAQGPASLLLWRAWLVWRALGRGTHPHPRFGAANRVTLVRLALATLLAALVGDASRGRRWRRCRRPGWSWSAATLTALLDAVDGPLARRSGLTSAFGARFDMETDAAFTLVLCALVLQAGQAGALGAGRRPDALRLRRRRAALALAGRAAAAEPAPPDGVRGADHAR